jgi:uncharacterized membrane protein YeaQ/YmgE (transglycosylase-associated protein family)
MTLESLLILVLVGAIAGWLAAAVMKGRGLGMLGNIVVGILGAFVGAWVLGKLGVSIGGGLLGSILRAFIGAVILLFVLGLIRRR